MVGIRIYEWRPAQPGDFGKSFGLRQVTRTIHVPTNAASAIRGQLERCVEKGHLGSEALAELNSGLRVDRLQHLLGELRRSGLAKAALGREESQEFVEEGDEGRDEEESEARDGSEGDEDETIASGARRRGRRTPKRQRPEAEADEFTSDEHLPGKMGGTTVTRSWAQYARDYARARGAARGDSLMKSLRDATDELEVIVQELEPLYRG
jgi:hypothetical protein